MKKMNSKEQTMMQMGFSKNGDLYIVGGGNTYDIKNEYKDQNTNKFAIVEQSAKDRFVFAYNACVKHVPPVDAHVGGKKYCWCDVGKEIGKRFAAPCGNG